MKRITQSILGGILFPVLYAVILGLIVDFLLPQYNLDTFTYNGAHYPGLVFAPVSIPLYLYIYGGDKINFHPIFGTFLFRTIWFLGFNILLYTFLTYLLLWFIDSFKKKEHKNYKTPPLPPEFNS